MSFRETLKGTGVALVTPFTSNGDVDYKAFEKLLDFVINNGAEYLVALGTTGESPTIDNAEKADIIHCMYEKVGNRVPMVVGVGGNNTKEVIHDLGTLPLHKSVAILSSSPNYNRPSQEGIYQHYNALATASPKPIILYNVPGRTGSNITAETTLRLAANENIIGIKEASGNMVQCMHILRDRPTDFLVTSGDDHLALSLIAAGMDGVISVAANCFPKDFTDMVRYCLANDFEPARQILYNLLEGFDLLFAENNPAGVKAFLAEMGIIDNHVRLPVVPVSDKILQQIKDCIKQLNTVSAA